MRYFHAPFLIKRFYFLAINFAYNFNSFCLTEFVLDENGKCNITMEISYLLLAAIFDRNEQLNLPMNNITPALQTINSDIHVPRIDSLKRHLLKFTEQYD